MALFSVIVPVYQAKAYLSECVQSVLTQSYTDFELILVDDGSTDGSGELCDTFLTDSRVKVIHQKNAGATKARLAAAECAVGKYLVPLDSDDLLLDGLLEELHRTVVQNRPDVICYNYIRADGNNGRCREDVANRLFAGSAWKEQRYRLVYDPSVPGFNSGITTNSLASKALRREMYLQFQEQVPPEIIRGEDLAVSAPLLYAAESVFFLDHDGYFYRDNPASQMNTFREADIELLRRLREYLLSAMGSEMLSQVDAFTAITASEYVMNAARHYASAADYRAYLKNNMTAQMTSVIRHASFGKLSVKERARILLAGHRLYGLLRLLVK